MGLVWIQLHRDSFRLHVQVWTGWQTTYAIFWIILLGPPRSSEGPSPWPDTPETDVTQEYGISCSFHQGATSEVTDKGVPPDVIYAIGHWRKSHHIMRTLHCRSCDPQSSIAILPSSLTYLSLVAHVIKAKGEMIYSLWLLDLGALGKQDNGHMLSPSLLSPPKGDKHIGSAIRCIQTQLLLAQLRRWVVDLCPLPTIV
jgi:hypothetical protein